MEILESTPDRVGLQLTFEKPWKATNRVDFDLRQAGADTEVTWRMRGTSKGLAALFGKVFSMDRLVGKDFEKGLARLKARAESEVPDAGHAGHA